MKDEQAQFLALAGRFPARLTVEQAAWVLNCQSHDMPILFAAKLLKPLGNPPVNGIKMVSADELLESAKDRSWLARVTNTIHQHWQRKNARRRDADVEEATAHVVAMG
jgi:hypothetical protein